MDPSGTIAAAVKPQNKKMWLKFALFIGGLVILIVVGSLIIKSVSPARKTTTVVRSQTNPQTQAESEVKTAFSSDKSIITYMNLASEEENSTQRYEYYKKAYSKMLLAYHLTKDAKQKIAINDLYSYLSSYKEFKATDLTKVQ